MKALSRVEGIWFCELTDEEVWRIAGTNVEVGRDVDLPDFRAWLREARAIHDKAMIFLTRINRSARLAEILNAELDAARVSVSMGVPVENIDAIRAHVVELKTILENNG